MIHEWRRDPFLISTDKTRLDLGVIHGYLSACSYWARGVPAGVVRRSVENSLAFGVYDDGVRQAGFARVITDYATFAYLADVFILAEYQGRGLGTWLVETIIAHPDLQGLRRWLLATADAHGLYEKVGFAPIARPERCMERHFPNAYGPPAEAKETDAARSV